MSTKQKLLNWKSIAIVVLLAALIIIPFSGVTNYVIQLFALTVLYAFWGNAWNIIGGFGGQFSLGHAIYVGIGAYVAIILYVYEGVSPWIGMIIAGFVSVAISLIIGAICFQLKGTYYTLSTIALLYVLKIFMLSTDNIFGYKTGAALGMKISWSGENFWNMQFVDKIPYYFIFLIFFIISLLLCVYIKKSKMGYYLATINTNQDAASSLGVNVMGYKLAALCISAFLTAVGGAVYAFFISVVEPTSTFSYDLSIKIMMLAVIGGRGTLFGPTIGAFILIPLNELLRAEFGSQLSGISFVIYGFILILIIMFIPKGLISLKESAKNTILQVV